MRLRRGILEAWLRRPQRVTSHRPHDTLARPGEAESGSAGKQPDKE
jgi:hypothetical protein